jgi:hypothetical protein
MKIIQFQPNLNYKTKSRSGEYRISMKIPKKMNSQLIKLKENQIRFHLLENHIMLTMEVLIFPFKRAEKAKEEKDLLFKCLSQYSQLQS